MTEKKYHELWYIQLTEKTVTASFLYFLKTAPLEQIRQQARVSRAEWCTNSFAVDWESFVANDHTRLLIEEPFQKLLEIREVLQPITVLLFPQWIMDRFKEALGQYVRGEWLSSISLCGDIVEFIVNDFWLAYADRIPEDMRKTPPSSVTRGLFRLFENSVIDQEDYMRLLFSRVKRDSHVHNYPRSFLLKKDYSILLKTENRESLKKLSEFFTRKNMESKYKVYLDYAVKQFFEPSPDL